jgi:hypothetical protein
VTIAVGDDATCTLTNTAIDPTLTLVKQVVNGHGGTARPTDWTLKATGPMTISGPTGSVAVTGVVVLTGAYALSESGPAGYSASSWTCTGATLSGATVQIVSGSVAVCTIVNTQLPPVETSVTEPATPPATTTPPPTSTLPKTGAAVSAELRDGVVILLVGGGLVLFARRRRK